MTLPTVPVDASGFRQALSQFASGVTVVTTRDAIQNGILLYPNRVASAGHVEVNACNFTGTSMTAISGFPVRVITLR